MFDFEDMQEDGSEDKYLSDSDSDEIVETRPSAPKTAPNDDFCPKSLPMQVPTRLRSMSSSMAVVDSDDDDATLDKPHELVAKTYKEYYLDGIIMDVPSRKVKNVL